MQLLTVRHITVYRYKQPVSFGEHRMMFRPRDSYDQKLIEVGLDITPAPAALRWVHDVFGNCVAIARFSGRAVDLRERRLRRRPDECELLETRAQLGERRAQVVRNGVRDVAHAVHELLDLIEHAVDRARQSVELIVAPVGR